MNYVSVFGLLSVLSLVAFVQANAESAKPTPTVAVSTSNDVQFSTAHGNQAELATIAAIQSLRFAHDLRRFEFSKQVKIDAKTIPHSHPVLTLHTRHTPADQRDLLLSTYIHENLHWWVNSHKNTDAAIVELEQLFPTMPVGYPQGADSERSGYAHLLVCYLEMAALRDLLSEPRVAAVQAFWQQDHYTWIYQQVATRGGEIAKVVEKYQLAVPKA